MLIIHATRKITDEEIQTLDFSDEDKMEAWAKAQGFEVSHEFRLAGPEKVRIVEKP